MQIPKLVPEISQEKKQLFTKYYSLIVFKRLLIYYKIFHCEKFIHSERLVIALTHVQKDHGLGLVQYELCMCSLLKPVRLLLDIIPQMYQLHHNAGLALNPTVYVIKEDIK